LGLTRREAEALAWLAGGKSNIEIAAILGLSPRTVAKHLERIYRKLGVESRTAAAACALEARAKGLGEGSCGRVRAR
jgi:DNA-binding CsgD family transcriptional regulator